MYCRHVQDEEFLILAHWTNYNCTDIIGQRMFILKRENRDYDRQRTDLFSLF